VSTGRRAGPAGEPPAAYPDWQFESSATRPVIRARRLVVSCGHYLAALAGMRMLALGGNAFDAGVAMVFAQAALECQSFGFGGEVPILLYSARDRRVVVIDGNTRAPAAATIEWFRTRGITLIPDDGFLPAGVCAVPAALIAALDRYGRLSLEQVLGPAIELAAGGFPMYEGMRRSIVQSEARFRSEWPTSAALLLPGGAIPPIGATWRNPDLARTFERLAAAERDARGRGRSAALRAALDCFYRGPIAREIVAFQRDTAVRDANGVVSSGLLAERDFAAFDVRIDDAPAGRLDHARPRFELAAPGRLWIDDLSVSGRAPDESERGFAPRPPPARAGQPRVSPGPLPAPPPTRRYPPAGWPPCIRSQPAGRSSARHGRRRSG